VLQRRSTAHRRAFAADRRTRAFQRKLVEPARLRVERAVEARELFLQHDVAGTLVAERLVLVVGVLERLEGAHHLAMRHHGVERNARLGLEIVVGIDIHWVLLANGCDSPFAQPAASRLSQARNILSVSWSACRQTARAQKRQWAPRRSNARVAFRRAFTR
jgi:hypothetical protein